jgi:membrane-associated phospholipid phosphatase
MPKRGVVLCAVLAALVAVATCVPIPADAEGNSTDRRAAKLLSGAGNVLYLSAGVALPLVEDGRAGSNHALRVIDALGTSVLFAEGLKAAICERRPGYGAADSFPSGHAAAAFAVATMESALHPRQAALWYGGATLIGASRVSLHDHYIHDVVAGAVLGYGIARWELSRPRGLILSPWVRPDSRSTGVQIAGSW